MYQRVVSTMEKYKLGREDNKAGTEDRNFVFFFNFWLYRVACGILVPWPGMEPASPALDSGVLTTGPLGKYLKVGILSREIIGGVHQGGDMWTKIFWRQWGSQAIFGEELSRQGLALDLGFVAVHMYDLGQVTYLMALCFSFFKSVK